MGGLKKPVNVGDSFAGMYLEQALRKYDEVDKKIVALGEQIFSLQVEQYDLCTQRKEIEEEIEILRREP